MLKVQEITITKNTAKGSNAVRWNVDLDGAPFGQVWTFKAKGEVHPFHAKPLAGDHKTFTTYAAAERYMRSCM